VAREVQGDGGAGKWRGRDSRAHLRGGDLEGGTFDESPPDRDGFAVRLRQRMPCLGQTDSFHLMQIEQVVGGVHGDTAKQAVQLRMRELFQNFVQGTQLKAYDAQGENPVVLITFGGNVPNFEVGDRILVVSPGFESPVAADFVMENPIPASYLAAGRITFEGFGELLWSLAWGGAAYTGSNLGSLTNDPDGDFGPPFPEPLPTAAKHGLLFTGPATAPSSTNAADYIITSGAAVLTNNAHQSGAIHGAGVCYPNCDSSTIEPVLNVADFSCFLGKFAAGCR
jgi:hypothetical protein